MVYDDATCEGPFDFYHSRRDTPLPLMWTREQDDPLMERGVGQREK